MNLNKALALLKRKFGKLSSYSENYYADRPRLTNNEYRFRLSSYQVPAIQKHFGSLENKIFLDIGAGDIILGEHQNQIGRPNKFYAQDLSEISLISGIKRLKSMGVDVSNITPLISREFDFSLINDESIDCAFSNSLFSHLALNSILLCLRNLRPKMKTGAKYISSMIVVPVQSEPIAYDWRYLGTTGSEVTSSAVKDPYHYSEDTIRNVLSHGTGFTVSSIHEYGHPFQRLVEFKPK